MDHILKSVWLSLKYFDLFDYPLKLDQVFKWYFEFQPQKQGSRQIFKPSLEAIKHSLEILVQQGKIEHQNGFYFLPGRASIIKIRQQRYLISLNKIKKAQRIAQLLSLVPGVRMIAICSHLGYLNAGDQADIDFFIVASPGRIWTVRFWCVFLMKILNQRPTPKNQKNKICLSYFITNNNLNLEFTKTKTPDIHLIYLLSQYLPIYFSRPDIWFDFCRGNKWIKTYLPNFDFSSITKKYVIESKLFYFKKIFELTQFPFEEQLYKKIELAIMPRALKQAMHTYENKVIVNDHILKLHLNDKREEYNRILLSVSQIEPE